MRTGDVDPVSRSCARANNLCAVRRARVRSEQSRVVVNRRLLVTRALASGSDEHTIENQRGRTNCWIPVVLSST